MTYLMVLLQAQGGGGLSMILMMVAIFAIMYFFMIRPQQKKQNKINDFRKALEVGSSVVTAGGIYGTVHRINDDNTIDLNVGNNVHLKVDRNSVYPNAEATQSTAK